MSTWGFQNWIKFGQRSCWMTPNFWYDIIRRLRKLQDTFKEQLKILLWFPLLPTDRDLSRLWTITSFYCRIIGMICRHHHLLQAKRIEKIRIFPGKSGFLQQFRFIGIICHHHLLRAIRIEKKPKSVENRRKSPKTAGIWAKRIEKKIFDQDISLLEII